ncbi:MAG: extracellular solute-binding protein [Clostridiales bacterium]|nr:extracellular solute-binding protein [Clostridiales bacterium]
MKKILSMLLAAILLVGVLPVASLGEDEIVLTREALGLPDLEITNNVVTYLTWGNAKSMESDAANLLMQEIYGCKIKVIRTTYQEIASKAASLRLSGNSPDLIQFREQEFPAFITNDVVDEVTQYLDFSDPLWAGLEEAAEAYSYKGKYYLFPTGKMYNNTLIYYWTSYFDDLGLETPRELYENGEWTYDTMRDLMKELTQDNDRDGIMDIYGLVLHVAYGYLQCGEDFTKWNAETGMYENNLRSPALAEYFDFIYETSSAGEDSRRMSLEAQPCFDNKEAVMMFNERWMLNSYYDQIMDGEIDIAPAPRMHEDDEKTVVRGRVSEFWLGKDSPNRNGALAYLACQRALALNEGLSEYMAEKTGNKIYDWPEEYEDLLKEMDDPEKFEKVMVQSCGVGTWGDDSWGVYDLYSCIAQFEIPWSTVVEKHYPLLQESVDMANGIYIE